VLHVQKAPETTHSSTKSCETEAVLEFTSRLETSISDKLDVSDGFPVQFKAVRRLIMSEDFWDTLKIAAQVLKLALVALRYCDGMKGGTLALLYSLLLEVDTCYSSPSRVWTKQPARSCTRAGGVLFMLPCTQLLLQWTDNFVGGTWMGTSRRMSGQ